MYPHSAGKEAAGFALLVDGLEVGSGLTGVSTIPFRNMSQVCLGIMMSVVSGTNSRSVVVSVADLYTEDSHSVYKVCGNE